MLYYNGIDLSEGIDVAKSNNSKGYIVCHYWYFHHGFKFQNSVCNGCHDLAMLCLNLSDVAIFTVKDVDYCITHDISESDAIHLLVNPVLEDHVYTKNHVFFVCLFIIYVYI